LLHGRASGGRPQDGRGELGRWRFRSAAQTRSRQMRTEPLDFVVLTGFLGSGKTTLLADYLASPVAADTAVIVNEVGEIDRDGAILRESGADVPMAMLSNGCVCCQMGSDLAVTIDALVTADRPGAERPLRRIILETSGLAIPGPVLRQLASLAEHRMRI